MVSEVQYVNQSGRLNRRIGVQGDSGGIMYTPYTGDGGGYNLLGTLNAGSSTSTYYSRIDRIKSELRISVITN